MAWARGCILALAVALTLLEPAVAAEPVSSGFVISPAFQELVVRQDQVSSQYNLQLTNRSAADQTFRLSVVDFGALDESGGVAFLGAPAQELEHRYGLASWMKLEKDTIVVVAGKSAVVAVTVQNRPSLSPGGHYGAVLATAVTDSGASQTTTDPHVGIKQVLSSLVLAVKDGGGERSLKMISQTAPPSWWRLPTQVEQRFRNAGNIHVTPRGVSEVRDSAGRVVARGALNEGSKVMLPESFRRYITPLTSVAPAWLPGRYTLITTYRYDGTDQTQSFTTHLWYAGRLMVWLVVLGALAVIAWWGWWLRRRYRRGRR